MHSHICTMLLLRYLSNDFSAWGRSSEKLSTGTLTVAEGNLTFTALTAPWSCFTAVARQRCDLWLMPNAKTTVSGWTFTVAVLIREVACRKLAPGKLSICRSGCWKEGSLARLESPMMRFLCLMTRDHSFSFLKVEMWLVTLWLDAVPKDGVSCVSGTVVGGVDVCGSRRDAWVNIDARRTGAWVWGGTRGPVGGVALTFSFSEGAEMLSSSRCTHGLKRRVLGLSGCTAWAPWIWRGEGGLVGSGASGAGQTVLGGALVPLRCL